jgi:hypothetical protein
MTAFLGSRIAPRMESWILLTASFTLSWGSMWYDCCIAYAPPPPPKHHINDDNNNKRETANLEEFLHIAAASMKNAARKRKKKKQGGFAYCPTGSSVTSPDGLVKKTVILVIRALASHFWIKDCTKSKKRVRASLELWKRTKPSDCLKSARVVVSRSVWCRCCLWWVGGWVDVWASEQASIGYSHGRAPELRKRLQVAAVRMTLSQ